MIPNDVEIELIEREGYLEARYLGTYSLVRYKRQMEVSVQACADRKLKLLLVDVTSMPSYKPTTMERFQIGEHGANISGHLARVACLALPEQIDPQDFTPTVARNRGLSIRAFTNRDQAIAWLLEARA
jgi:hypothetical protein